MKITLGTADINWKTILNFIDCYFNKRIGQGKFIEMFERKVAKFVGTKYAISTCNGSTADLVSLLALKQLYPNKTEVIVPALTFIAQTNSIIFAGLKPVFVDVRYDYQINSSLIEKSITENTLAIMPANLLGKKCDMDKIIELSKKYHLPILEDSCEAFGIKPYLMATYSFYPSHTISTGEGGMIVTDNDKIASLCYTIRSHGRRAGNPLDAFHFDIIGFNGRMSNISAAIGSSVIGLAGKIIKKRRDNVVMLNEATEQNWYAESPHSYPVMCATKKERDSKILELDNSGIESRTIFSSLPTQEKAYNMRYKLGDFPIAEDIGNRGFYVPIHQNLSKKDIKKLCQKIKH